MTQKSNYIIILFLICTTSYCQMLKGIYISQPLKGTGEETTLSKKGSNQCFFSYQYSNSKSIAQLISEEKTTVDTSYIEKYNQKFETTHTVRRPFSTTYYKDFTNSNYKVLNTLDGIDMSVKEKLPIQDWKLQ